MAGPILLFCYLVPMSICSTIRRRGKDTLKGVQIQGRLAVDSGALLSGRKDLAVQKRHDDDPCSEPSEGTRRSKQ